MTCKWCQKWDHKSNRNILKNTFNIFVLFLWRDIWRTLWALTYDRTKTHSFAEFLVCTLPRSTRTTKFGVSTIQHGNSIVSQFNRIISEAACTESFSCVISDLFSFLFLVSGTNKMHTYSEHEHNIAASGSDARNE